jgi:hypothetical protein
VFYRAFAPRLALIMSLSRSRRAVVEQSGVLRRSRLLNIAGSSKNEFNFRPHPNIPERADIHSVACEGKETMEIK